MIAYLSSDWQSGGTIHISEIIMSKNKQKFFIFLVLAVAFCGMLFSPLATNAVAYADEIAYSDVLTDLQKSENFNAEDYPAKDDDYSLEVIQIAESVDDELLVYVYQPSADKGNIKATALSMSTAISSDISPTLWELEFLNSNGVFYKYRVKNFIVSEDDTRIYSIVSIFRPYITGVDEEVANDNTVSEVSYAVAKEYTFYSGQDNYQMEVLDVIEITSKFVGYVRYFVGGNLFFNTSSDSNSHFVAFATDRRIDDLLDAELYFESQSYKRTVTQTGNPSNPQNITTDFTSEVEAHYVRYSSEDKMEFQSKGLFGTSAIRDRIQTIDEFIASETMSDVYTGVIADVTIGYNLTSDATNALKDMQWVVRFADYESKTTEFVNNSVTESTCVTNVSILRLKFVTDGIVYNLGVVDNKQTGSDKPVNDVTVEIVFKLLELLKDSNVGDILAIFLIVLLLVVVIAVSAPILPYVFKAVLSITLWFGKVLGRHTKRTMKSVRNVAESTKDLIKKTKVQREREEKRHQKKLKKELRKKHSKKG